MMTMMGEKADFKIECQVLFNYYRLVNWCMDSCILKEN